MSKARYIDVAIQFGTTVWLRVVDRSCERFEPTASQKEAENSLTNYSILIISKLLAMPNGKV